MSDFSDDDDSYNMQCCSSNVQPDDILTPEKCNPNSSGLFYRYCLSRNHLDKVNGKCPNNTTLQPDSCIISGPGSTGHCASTLNNLGHVRPAGPGGKGGSKQCTTDSQCDEVCYTEITSGKVYETKPVVRNKKWKNAHNCDKGPNNEIGIEPVLPCELRHCEANCYGESNQCVDIYQDNNDNVNASPSPACNTYNSNRVDCDNADHCRYIRDFGAGCNKITINKSSCKTLPEGELCMADGTTPNSGTCMYQTGPNGPRACMCQLRVRASTRNVASVRRSSRKRGHCLFS